MAQFSLRVRSEAGCLDRVAEALQSAHVTSMACACEAGAQGFATFSVREADVTLGGITHTEAPIPILQVSVRNEAGCLSRVVTSLSRAGVSVGSLACACAEDDVTGIVSVGLLPRT
jgi:hypothetical protein